ncbi:MAG: 4-(cytidine 5'-diphospho)-2-C-methyl-D-erythritol kinase [Bacteroidia bacterium]|nr:4-(cytidine 5'-diphospho)-2-C-methyl-D-erythritol kinase [Bacteroidia bacterium]
MDGALALKCNAKINIGLFIKGKRPDGYHEIETVYYPVMDMYDDLTVQRLEGADAPVLKLTGLNVPGNPEDNLCIRAWKALKALRPEMPAVTMRLHKRIPVGAGLGGGSSNAAFVLRALNFLFALDYSLDELKEIGVKLGADVPFFLENRPLLARGIGDKFFEIKLNLPYRIEIMTQPIQSDTALAYKEIDLQKCSLHKNLERLITSLDIRLWKDHIVNDFEPTVFRRFPELLRVKNYLYKKGALYASMSGTGSAVYGIFKM